MWAKALFGGAMTAEHTAVPRPCMLASNYFGDYWEIGSLEMELHNLTW